MSVDTKTAIAKLRKFYLVNRRMPTTRELAELCHYASHNASVKLINRLIAIGILSKDTTGHLIPNNLFTLPHLGIIKAGHPTEAYTEQTNLDLYRFLYGIPTDSFSLTVKGDSMKDAGMTEGDIVIVAPEREPHEGDIVAACVDNEWTVKYFSKRGGKVCLVPANDNYPIIYPTTSLTIGGIVVHLIRTFH